MVTVTARAGVPGPEIRISIPCSSGPVSILQNRPSIANILRGCDPGTALARVPLLLPVCGVAQSVAAARALDAARGQPTESSVEIRRSIRVLSERAVALAWRFAIDWPAVIGQPPELVRVKRIRQAAAALSRTVDETEPLDLNAVSVQGRELAETLGPLAASDGIAPVVLAKAAAFGLRAQPLAMLHPNPAELIELARTAFAAEPFDPLAPESPGPIVCGPVAGSSVASDLVQRLAAMVRDVEEFGDRLRETLHGQFVLPAGVQTAPGAGLGAAMTARGPICHWVALDASGHSADWRILAPTDWHFAPNGPVAHELAAMPVPDPVLARLIIASFDPCCPVHVDLEDVHA